MYEQKLWQDHVTEFEDRYTESRNDDGTITHTPVEGEIIQQGTPQNATNFNHMENGISNATETAALMALSTIHHQQAIADLQGETATVTLKNTQQYPFNNSTQSVALKTERNHMDYTVETEIEGYKVRILGDNNTTDHSCMNCHTSNKADSPATFFHVRGKTGGTFYAKDGALRKLDTKTDSTAGAAVYGEIEKSGRFGIFTTARIMPILHSGRLERLEVFDTSSDLFVVDFQDNTVSDNPSVR